MFLSFYIFIIIWILQVSDSVNAKKHHQFQPLKNKQNLQRLGRYAKNASNDRNDEEYDEAKAFQNIQEIIPQSSTIRAPTASTVIAQGDSLSDLKIILQKLLTKLNNMERSKKDSNKNNNKIIITSSSMSALQGNFD